MDEDQLREVYEMVDGIPLSRPKKNISRDFSDGAMMAEVILHYRPKSVNVNSYPAVNATDKKIQNWKNLNQKVLKKMGLSLTHSEIEEIANSIPMAIQAYLYRVLMKFETPEEEANIHQHNKSNIRKNEERSNKNFINSPKANTAKSSTPMNQKRGAKANLQFGESEEVMELIDEIEQSYAKLIKLQEVSKMKDEFLKNLEKKIEKMIFS